MELVVDPVKDEDGIGGNECAHNFEPKFSNSDPNGAVLQHTQGSVDFNRLTTIVIADFSYTLEPVGADLPCVYLTPEGFRGIFANFPTKFFGTGTGSEVDNQCEAEYPEDWEDGLQIIHRVVYQLSF